MGDEGGEGGEEAGEGQRGASHVMQELCEVMFLVPHSEHRTVASCRIEGEHGMYTPFNSGGLGREDGGRRVGRWDELYLLGVRYLP